MLVLRRSEVEELLDLDALLDALASAHSELSAGKASLVPRMGAFAGDAGILGAMPAYAPSSGLGCKLVTLFPGNRDRPTHQALLEWHEKAGNRARAEFHRQALQASGTTPRGEPSP